MSIFKKYVSMDQVKQAFNDLSVPPSPDLDTFVTNGLNAIKAKKEEAEAYRQTHARLVDQAKSNRTVAISAAADNLTKVKESVDLSGIPDMRFNARELLSASKNLQKVSSLETLLNFAGVEPDVLTKMYDQGNANIAEADRLEAEANDKLAKANEAYRAASVTAGNNYTQALKNAAPNMEKAAQLLAEANTITNGIKFFSA